MNSELIHIGYHKTASTWLQKNLFDNESSGFKRYISQKELRDKLILVNGLNFDVEEFQDYYQNLLDDNFCSVISNERLSGNPHSGGYDSKEIADRLKACFPKGKVLIIIREQKDMILSTYIQYVRAGGACALHDYLEPSKRNQAIMPLFNYEYFNYFNLVSYYQKLFSKENVLVLPFELFKSEPKLFAKKISDFSSVKGLEELPFSEKTNRRISTLSSIFLRQSNKVFAKTRLNPFAIDLNSWKEILVNPYHKKQDVREFEQENDKHVQKFEQVEKNEHSRGNNYKNILLVDSIIPKKIHKFFDTRIKEIITKKVNDKYIASNKKLAEIINTDLSKYGY
ncbi:MAG: sulfotransferase domain-containing protein [Candidatus Caenarcaniphilales bacterium]|nr:sulfotransferase domain-containing protein [Candidatus Caenarcaniphilales bacterium]